MHSLVDVGEGLATAKGTLVLVFEGAPVLGRDLRDRRAIEVAVIDFDEGLLHDLLSCSGSASAAVSRARASGETQSSSTPSSQGRERSGLTLTELGEVGIAPTDEQSLLVGRRLTVANEDDHGSKSRPHSGQSMKVSSGERFESVVVEGGERDATPVAAPLDDLGRARTRRCARAPRS